MAQIYMEQKGLLVWGIDALDDTRISLGAPASGQPDW